MSWSAISKILGVAATALGLFLLYRVMMRYDLAEVYAALGRLSLLDLAIAAGFCVLSFICLIATDYLGLRYAEHDVGLARVAKTTVAALGIGHTLGLAALSSGAIRYRMYGRAGLDLPSLGKVLLFVGMTVAIGVFSIAGIAMLAHPAAIDHLIGLSDAYTRWIGTALLALVGLYLGACALHPRGVRLFRTTFYLPSFRLAALQFLAGALNYAAVAGSLYACLRPFADTDYPTVAALYAGADIAAMVGHIPGGWGVLEYVVTAALAQPQLIAGVLAFRAIYYLAPLFVGLVIFAQDEFMAFRDRRAEKTLPHVKSGEPALQQH